MIWFSGVNVKDFSIFRAKFPDKGPDENFRSAAIFGASKKVGRIFVKGTLEYMNLRTAILN